ncbi:MAG: septal ring lytic transglycosylase RlpA family protein [Thiohalocapsa sp.]|nr:septal ring lytic transglycosylase RlpA family protein [Thiohalocapsa sp.]MCF7988924.1 septal ring lytic transglycosylase RlpA family protein [Thiohalocapsa sp.]
MLASIRFGGAAPAAALRARNGLLPALPSAALAALLIVGCAGPQKKNEADFGGPPDPVPKVEPKAKYGNMESYVVFGQRYYPKPTSRDHVERGIASWYGPKFHGRKTSSGEIYDMHQMTAAHKTLPLPTYARVTNLENGRSAVVRINDRGPFVGDRVIDLSLAAAEKLDVVKNGTAEVEVVSIDPRDHGGKVPRRHRVASAAPVSAPAAAPKHAAAASADHDPFGELRARPAGAEPVVTARVASPELAAAGGASTAVPSFATPPSATAARVVGVEGAPGALGPSSSFPAAQPAVAAGDSGPLYLQVGAFGTRDNAEQLRGQLLGLLQDPGVQVSEPAGATGDAQPGLYRVRIGPVATQADASDLTRKLDALGIGRPILVAAE